MSSVYKSYDIRGIYPREINESLFYQIGLRIGNVLGTNKIAIGRDARLSSDSLFESLRKGISDSGTNIVNIGIVTSPMLSFFCVRRNLYGIMISASHNPKEYNGLKFIDNNGIQMGYDSLLAKLELSMSDISSPSKRKGRTSNSSILSEYQRYIKSNFNCNFKRDFKVIFDCSNGVGSIPIKVIKELGINHLIINKKIDGNFPAHPCNNTIYKNLSQLRKEVIRNKADLGIMFDGDADRCSFIDEKGRIIPIDIAFLLLSIKELETFKRGGKPAVLFDLRFSRAVKEIISKRGGKPIIMKVGNPFYKKGLHKIKNAIIAGELSGHIMYRENYAIDDPLFASLKMISLLSNSDKPISFLISENKRYFSEREISIETKNVQKVMASIGKFYRKFKPSSLDGISVEKGSSWFNIRPSNTEPLLRVTIEGKNKSALNNQKKEIISLIKKYDKI